MDFIIVINVRWQLVDGLQFKAREEQMLWHILPMARGLGFAIRDLEVAEQ